jgi:hypothetical protein
LVGFNRLIEFDAFHSALKALPHMPQKDKYTCSDYREEMRLIGLKKRLSEEALSQREKQVIEAEIADLEKILDLD